MQKKIFFHADDFGVSQEINKAIEIAYKKGKLNSASIIPTMPFALSALKIAQKNPNLKIGIHLSLTWGKGILPHSQIPLLTDSENYFNANFLKLFLLSLFSQKFRLQIKEEFEAQIKSVQKEIKIIQLDSQSHIHILPGIFPIVLRLASKHNIPSIRIPNEPFPLKIILKNPSLIKYLNPLRGLIINLFTLFLPNSSKKFHSIWFTGCMYKEVLKQILNSLSYHSHEILFHPSYPYKKNDSNFNYNKQGIRKYISHINRHEELNTLITK